MKTRNRKKVPSSEEQPVAGDFFGTLWDKSWTYIKTVVDVVHEPVLILDKNFCVMAANEPFYRTFQVEKKDTEGKMVYKLGNGQWNIPALRELLEKILPKNTFFNGFEVAHAFPVIGRKVMMLNARQIQYDHSADSESFPPIILLAIEDVTEMMTVAESLLEQIQRFEQVYGERTGKLELTVSKLTEELRKNKINESH